MAITTTKQVSTYVLYTADGTTTDYTVPFDYIASGDIHVLSGAVVQVLTTNYSFPDKDTLRFTSAPASGVEVEITRITDISSALVTYSDSATLDANDLNTMYKHLLYRLQELSDQDARAWKASPTIPASDNTALTLVSGGSATYVSNVKVDEVTPKIQQSKSAITLQISQNETTNRTEVTLVQGAESDSDVIEGQGCAAP